MARSQQKNNVKIATDYAVAVISTAALIVFIVAFFLADEESQKYRK